MDVVRNRFLLTSDLGTCCMTNGGGGGDNAQSRANDSSLYNWWGVASEIIGVASEIVGVACEIIGVACEIIGVACE